MPSASVEIAGGWLRVVCDDAQDLLSAPHRLFFTSILRFTAVGDEFAGYRHQADGRVGGLLEIVLRYLESHSVAAHLDEPTAALLHARKSSGQALEAALRVGAEVHQRLEFEYPEVPGLKRMLKDYQVPAVVHMLAVGHCANFSVPGSGKTTMVLAAYAYLQATSEVETLLVIGPRSCFAPWEEEFEGCFARKARSIRLSGTRSDRVALHEKSRGTETELVLVTYHTAANDVADVAALLRSRRTMLVLDESHYIKRLNGGVWARTVMELSPYAAKRVVLTGTPVPNGIEDIWSQMTFLWPEPPVLGSREKFTDRLANGGPDVTDEIRDDLLPLFWRVKKSDVQLPAPEFHRIDVPLKPYQATIYRALAAKVLSDIEARPSEREKLRQWRKAKMVRLLQAATNPSLLTEFSPEFKVPPLSAKGLSTSQIIEGYSRFEVPAKVDFTIQLVESILAKDQSAKVVVWSAFVHNLTTLGTSLARWQPRVIHGEIPKDASEDLDFNRESLIHEFKTDPRFRLMLANPGACAESISLHRVCKHAVYMDRSFNGAQYMQSLDRIHRLGLLPDDKVHYYLLNAIDTIDAVVDARLDEKRDRLLRLLEGDLTTVDLDDRGVSEEAEEESDFEAMVKQLRSQFGARTVS
jgi:SNF2 family DNA or RNA helicase